jgi:hypothetical protein
MLILAESVHLQLPMQPIRPFALIDMDETQATSFGSGSVETTGPSFVISTVCSQ